MLLAKGEADPALDLLRRLYADAAAGDRTGSVMEIQALRALALAATGDEIHALTALEEALTLAYPEGNIRVFADEGPTMAALLDRLITNRARLQATGGSVLMAYLGRLEREFELDTDPRSKRTSLHTPGLVMALSAREHEVLHLLAAGKQNREIAEELYVTKDTVKKHVAHILDKLGAANRTQAVARARELGLLA